MHKTTFDGMLKASANQAHPLQTNIEFIFTDFRPNRNKTGVPFSEAENIINTGLNMPIKVNFAGGQVRGHTNALPIGPIINMSQQGDRIIGNAIIWKDEFPDLTEYLEQASKEGDGVQFSWELYYKDKSSDDSGISWLQGCIVAGAAIVADPAYAGRTHLLALAEENIMELDQLQSQVNELTDKLWSMIEALYAAMALPGAVDRASGIEDQFTSVINALKGMAETHETEKTQLTSELDTAKSELAELRTFKTEAEAKQARNTLLDARRIELKDIIAFDDFEAKAEFILGLDDTQFKAYVESLSVVAKSSKAGVSKAEVLIPDPVLSQRDTAVITRSDIAKALRQIRSA